MNIERLKQLRQRNKPVWGIHLSFLCPEMIEFYGLLGFEWLLLDAEHQPLDHRLCRDLVRAADVAGMPCAVRVPRIEAAVIEGFLDAGVLGILAPNVSSADEARALVAAMKFSPEGQRGAASRTRAANYGLTQTPAEYCRQANQAISAIALIETQHGVDQLESIMAVPGIDYVAIGPNDLGLSMGIDAGMADARVRALVEVTEARIRAHGKPQLAVVQDCAQADRAVAAGAKLIAVSDATLLAGAGRSFLQHQRT